MPATWRIAALRLRRNTGDGAGIMTQMPDAFLRLTVALAPLPPAGEYGLVWCSCRTTRRRAPPSSSCSRRSRRKRARRSSAGATCRPITAWLARVPSVEPAFAQVFIGSTVGASARPRRGSTGSGRHSQAARECRGRAAARGRRQEGVHVRSPSSRTLVYKGMLKADRSRRCSPIRADPPCRRWHWCINVSAPTRSGAAGASFRSSHTTAKSTR